MPKKPPVIYAECHGELYIKSKFTGIDLLVRMIDGLEFTYFEKDRKTSWMRVTTVIDWHTKELEITKGRGGSRIVVEVLTKVLAEFNAEMANRDPEDNSQIIIPAIRMSTKETA